MPSAIKFTRLLLGCCFCVAVAHSQTNTNLTAYKVQVNENTTSSSSGPRQFIPFDKDWRFFPGDDAAAKEEKYDDSRWRVLTLPHDWSIKGPVNPPPLGDRNTGYFTHGICWYRKSFSTPDTTKKIVVEFDGIYMNSVDQWQFSWSPALWFC